MICPLLQKKSTVTIADLFKTMNDSPATFTHSKLAQEWLKAHDNYFAGFVDGKWTSKPTTSNGDEVEVSYAKDISVTVKVASSKDLGTAEANALEGFKRWQQCEAETKSKVLYRIAQSIEQHSKLLNGVENLIKYGRTREKQNVPYLIDSFNYCAGLVGDKELSKGWKSTGVVCVVVDDACSAMLSSPIWRVSSILAAGNAVLFLVDCKSNLSAFLLAELCNSAGLPPGVFNVLSCNKSSLTSAPKVDKIIISSLEQKQVITATTSEMCVPCEFLLHKWPTVVVYESADLDAAITGILEMLSVTDTEEAWPICKIYVQESVVKMLIKLLTKKMCGSVGGNITKPLFYIMGSQVITKQLQDMLSTCSSDGKKEIYNVCRSVLTEDDKKCTPAVILNFNVDSLREQNQTSRSGPGIYVEPFRTIKESISMFNTDKIGPDVSIWTEEMYLALEVAHKLKTRTVWINSQYLYEPSVAHGSIYLSGNSVIGGKEGFFSHLSILERDDGIMKPNDASNIQCYGAEVPSSNVILLGSKEEQKIAKSMKLFIDGSFTNSIDETVQIALDAKNEPYAYVASANKSDIDKAVSCASSSQPKWESLLKTKRSTVLRKATEVLSKRKEEFVSELCAITGSTKEFCSKEIEIAVNTLFFWANYITHFDGQAIETKLYSKVFQEHHPIGVIGVQCPDKEPLLSFVFLVTPAIIFGNAVVAIASEKYPTCILKMCEVFQAAGLPKGVLNVVASSRSYLTRHLSSHLSIDAMWFSVDGQEFLHNSCHTVQPKRIFNCKDLVNQLDDAKKLKFVYESTYSKAVFMPMGTGFA